MTARPREIVLVGGGHAHVEVLRSFGRRPEPEVKLTLVTRDLDTPYSGMLPGLVAGLYERDEIYIDLVKLCAATRTTLVHATATGLDLRGRQVMLQGRPPVPYEIVSLDVGITPALDRIAGAATHGIAVKPIGRFLAKFDALLARLYRPDGPRRLIGVGGGAGGVELLLSLRHRLRRDAPGHGVDPDAFSFTLVTGGPVLATHNRWVQNAFRESFAKQRVTLFEHCEIAEIRAGSLVTADGAAIEADAALVTTHAAAPGWLRDTGLKVDEDGFVEVGPTLQSLGDPRVFAAGDCAALVETPREKAGVYAVRAGPPLARNLRSLLRGDEPAPWRPQKRHLALISTGGKHAVASRGRFYLEGGWIWAVKEWNDRRWMRKYKDLRVEGRRQSVAGSAVEGLGSKGSEDR